MKVRIESKPGFAVKGLKWSVSTRDGENFRVIPQYWERAIHDGTTAILLDEAHTSGVFKGAELGVCFNFDGANQRFDYMIAVESDGQASSDRWKTQQFPPSTFAIFSGSGEHLPTAIQGGFKYIHRSKVVGTVCYLLGYPVWCRCEVKDDVAPLHGLIQKFVFSQVTDDEFSTDLPEVVNVAGLPDYSSHFLTPRNQRVY